MRAYLTLLVLVVLGIGSFAGGIRKGATMEVKPNSICFQDAARLTHWQELKKSGDAPALTSCQHEVLSHRDAWQFLNQLTVKILSYEPRKNQVNVEMKTPGECWAAHGCWTPMLLCNSYHSCHRLVAGSID